VLDDNSAIQNLISDIQKYQNEIGLVRGVLTGSKAVLIYLGIRGAEGES
jgi:hypothetical protein